MGRSIRFAVVAVAMSALGCVGGDWQEDVEANEEEIIGNVCLIRARAKFEECFALWCTNPEPTMYMDFRCDDCYSTHEAEQAYCHEHPDWQVVTPR